MYLYKLCIFVIYFSVIHAREYTEEELANFPKLYHLDDYDRCLAKKGVYCVGTLALTPEVTPHPLFESLKERSRIFFKYNRTQIHRGYCITDRLKQTGNETELFEKCAARSMRQYALTPHVVTATCTTHELQKKHAEKMPDFWERMLLYVVYFVLFMNFIGTVYDMNVEGENKNRFLTSWSLPSNWEKLTRTQNDALSPIQGLRTILQWMTIYVHCGLLHFRIFTQTPDDLENFLHQPFGSLLRNGTTVTQTFIIIACFLTAYNMLSYAQKNEITSKTVAKWILKRIVRISPVYILVVWYGATWWRRLSSGPIWPLIVEPESDVCKKKFWLHVFFLNNLINADEICMVQGWATAIDIQMYIVSVIITVLFIKYKLNATKILGFMFVVSCLVNVAMSYMNGWLPMMKILTPEIMKVMFKNQTTVANLHISPLGNLPACLLGLFVAHVLSNRNLNLKAKTEDGEEKKPLKNNKSIFNTIKKIVIRYTDVLCVTGIVLWLSLSVKLDDIDSKILWAFYVGMERLVYGVLFSTGMVFTATNIGFCRKFLGWSGWYALGRLTFSLAAVHWCIGVAIVAMRPLPVPSSSYYMSLDWAGTLFYSYVAALPVCLLIEFPIQRTFDIFLS